MQERLHLKPAQPGYIVRIPEAGFRKLPDEGEEVVVNAYWRQRLADADVVVVLVIPKEIQKEPEIRAEESEEKSYHKKGDKK